MSQQNKVEVMWHGDYNDKELFPVSKQNDAGFETISSQVLLPNSEGIKHDNGKPDLSFISSLLVTEVAKVRAFGAQKYSRNNWVKGFKYTRSIAAALRHIFAFNSGENLDPESGESHISHAICCLEHLLNDIKNNPQNDDRDKLP